MKRDDKSLSAADRYAAILKNGRKGKLPPGYPQPQPPQTWPPENVALLARYLAWLVADNAGETSIQQFYMPVAGHVLGYHLRPHRELDLEGDLERVMAFLQAKQLCDRWLRMSRHALTRFRRFLEEERSHSPAPAHPASPDLSCYQASLPAWLVTQLTRLQHLRQANWRPARLAGTIRNFWHKHTSIWRWLFAHYPIVQVTDVKRAHVFAYLDQRLAAGYGVRGINQDLRCFQATLRFLRERDVAVPEALLRMPGLRQPDSLPRFLTDDQVLLLQADLEARIRQARTPARRRDALLDRAAFYLLWQGGLRVGEVEELRLAHLNLTHQQLVIRRGKGLHERVAYLTERAVAALEAYLAVRGSGAGDHVFLYRHEPLKYGFIRNRMRAAGQRTGVKVTPHRLRHTYATQLLNAECSITAIQALLGHRRLQNTLTYARVHDHTVAEAYFTAMATVEQRLALPAAVADQPAETGSAETANDADTSRVATLVEALQAEALTASQQALVNELRRTLDNPVPVGEPE